MSTASLAVGTAAANGTPFTLTSAAPATFTIYDSVGSTVADRAHCVLEQLAPNGSTYFQTGVMLPYMDAQGQRQCSLVIQGVDGTFRWRRKDTGIECGIMRG